MLLELIDGELRRPDQSRLQEIDSRWWLRDERDIEAAALPLSDRVEWAVFSLLSTAGGLTESAFFDRIATMFRGHDTPDEALVRACLESYRSRASTPDLLKTNDELQARYADHTELVGQLVEYGHRLGLRCWVGKSEQKRVYRGIPLVAHLSDVEQRVYLPLISRGPLEALEQTDVIWYLRNKATFLIEVEWTAMLGEPLLKRGARIQAEPTQVRFLVVLPERVELVRFKLRSIAAAASGPRARQLAYPEGRPPARPGRAGGGKPRAPRAVPRPRPGDRARWRATPALRMSLDHDRRDR